MGDLLKAMVEVAKPASGASKILIAIARIARPSVDWIEGSLRVELQESDKGTKFAIMEDLGGGVRELVYPRFVVKVPLDEFARGLKLAPRVVEPLIVRDDEADGKIILVPKRRGRTTLEPPTFEIAEESLRKSLPPTVRKSLVPPARASKRVTRRPSKPPPEVFTLEIPRTPKILDLGEFANAPLKVRAKKKPSS